MQLVYGCYFLISIFMLYLVAPIYINIIFKNKNKKEKIYTTILFIMGAIVVIAIAILSIKGMIGLI